MFKTILWSAQVKGKNTEINKQSHIKFWLNWIEYGAVSYSISCIDQVENISYLQWCILRLCLGWELLQNLVLELRVPCPIMIWCNSCWNKWLSKSWLEENNCSNLQVLLVLCPISPWNDHVAVWTSMVLKFEKKCAYEYVN